MAKTTRSKGNLSASDSEASTGASSRFWANRVIGYEELDPEHLLANPKNWRIHPGEQQEALEAVLEEVGYVAPIVINKRTGFVVDGHLRVSMALSKGQPFIPAVVVDLSEAEEDAVLATLDPLGAMAVTDQQALGQLVDSIEVDNEALTSLLERIRPTGYDAADFLEDLAEQDVSDAPGVEDFEPTGTDYVQLVYTVTKEQRAVVNEAVKLMRERTGDQAGTALTEICQGFLRRES